MQQAGIFAQLLLAEARRRLLEESIPRLRACLERLSEEDIWYRPNARSNSVGNLVLHLAGNVRQWLGSGLGKLPDERQRSGEFSETGPLPKADLYRRLDETAALIESILDATTAEALLQTHPVQCYQENGVSILVHVIEHFSYHVGQVTYFTKARLDVDTGYYAGQNLG